MPQEELPPFIRDFIAAHIRSVEQLEILLLFSKSPTAVLTPEKVYDAILSTRQSVQHWLDELSRAGLLEKLAEPASGYRCCSEGATIQQIVALADIYHTTPVRVIEAIYRPRASAAQSFADAFKITKDDNPKS